MSQRAVESVLGRLITDAAFRARFSVEPFAACRDLGLDLTADEIAALLALDTRTLECFAGRLNPKIVRALTVRPLEPAVRAMSRTVADAFANKRLQKMRAGRIRKREM